MTDDWFAEAAKEVSETTTARAVAKRARTASSNDILAKIAAGAAAKEFEAVALGLSPMRASAHPTRLSAPRPGSSEQKPRTTEVSTAEQGLAAIIAEVRSSDDPFVTAGQWITRITNGITEAVRSSEEQ